jgi:asparagine synthase (glutamine-hydrolysing)
VCGIAGIVGEGAGGPEDRAVLAAMLASMAHRGPDDESIVTGDGFAIGARRLSIVDLEAGRQPMVEANGPVVVAQNGEIYGHRALRAGLEARGARFSTRSDTEVLLRLFERDGERAIPRLEGMYALAAWDGRTRTLVLARDRLGEKPLVWFEARGRLVFASEWRALALHPDAPREPDPDALALYLLHRFVPAPKTAVRGVSRIPPAHLLVRRGGRTDVRPYWSLPVPGPDLPDGCASPREAAATVRRLLEAAVESRLEADVPLGVFLSGGLDSAALAAIAARRGPVKTFTLRPEDTDFDEGPAAAETARAIGAEHEEIPVDAAALSAGFDEVFDRLDEPIGDPSLVPTLLLARGARRRVKVVLGGEGADELFGGYPTYLGARWSRAAARLPRWTRRAISGLAAGGRKAHGNVGTRWLLRRLLDGAETPPLERHLEWFGAFPASEQALLFRPEARPAVVLDGLLDPVRAAAGPASFTGDEVDPLLRVDLLMHLPEALLAKVDRATMLVSLEARAPYLERNLVETATRLPARWKVSRKTTKRVLRAALEGLVPAGAISRRKRGFAVPTARALDGPLGDRLRERLARSRLARDFLDPFPALALLDEHRSGRADHARRLYPLLALLEWGERWLSPARAAATPPAAVVAS